MLEVDKSSDESNEQYRPDPFPFDIAFTPEEMAELREAFDIYKEDDDKIDFYDFFHHMEDHGTAFSSKKEHQLVYGTLRKIQKSKEKLGDGGRVDFDTFVELLKMALNVRRSKNHVRLLWNIFDRSKTGTITSSDVAAIHTKINKNARIIDSRHMVQNCSYSGQGITFNEFFQLMTRPEGMQTKDLDYVVRGRAAKSRGRYEMSSTLTNIPSVHLKPYRSSTTRYL